MRNFNSPAPGQRRANSWLKLHNFFLKLYHFQQSQPLSLGQILPQIIGTNICVDKSSSSPNISDSFSFLLRKINLIGNLHWLWQHLWQLALIMTTSSLLGSANNWDHAASEIWVRKRACCVRWWLSQVSTFSLVKIKDWIFDIFYKQQTWTKMLLKEKKICVTDT